MEPLLGYKSQNYRRDLHIPFKVLDRKIVIDPKNTYGASDSIHFLTNVSNLDRALWEGGRVRVEVRGLKPVDPHTKSFDLNLRNYPFRQTLTVTYELAGGELPPDYYEMELFLLDGQGETVDTQKVSFTVSPQPALAHPIAHSKAFPHARSYLYFFALAGQAETAGDFQQAEGAYRRAFESNPDYKQGIVDYANFLYKVRKFDESVAMIERLRDDEDEQMRFQYYLVNGRALMGKSLYREAIDHLLEGNRIYNSDTGLLNSLGICYHRIGEDQKALDALNASLRLNPAQDDVKALVAEIEKKS
jgi:tetratricopeptide (TPR) repeat protein